MPQLTSAEFPRRVRALQTRLRKARLDGIIVHQRTNALYLTGLDATLIHVLVTPRECVLLLDGRYFEAGRAAAPHCETRLLKNLAKDLAKWRRQTGARRIGVEDETPWGTIRRWQEALPEAELEPASDLMRGLRIVKSPGEIRLIAEAARLNDALLKRVAESVEPGQSETDLRRILRAEVDRLGDEGEGFPCIVCGGANGSRPHHHPGSYQFRRGDLLLIDLGILHAHYNSDMTRTFGLGVKPKPKLMKVYEAVREAEETAMAAVAPGVACRELDAIARDVLRKRGFERYFTHGLGHGVGLDIHEAPTLNKLSDEVLRPGMVVTIEPGVYLPGLGGVRIEDLVVVTKDGHKVLSRSPREFQILPFG